MKDIRRRFGVTSTEESRNIARRMADRSPRARASDRLRKHFILSIHRGTRFHFRGDGSDRYFSRKRLPSPVRAPTVKAEDRCRRFRPYHSRDIVKEFKREHL